jgi:hypothetical protein
MSGLLLRLAARAIGTAPAVRPIVGWAAPAPQADPAALLLPSPPAMPSAGPPSPGEHSRSRAAPPATVAAHLAAEAGETFAAPLRRATRASHGADPSVIDVGLDAAAEATAPVATASVAAKRARAQSETASQALLEPAQAGDPQPRDRGVAFQPLLPQRGVAVATPGRVHPVAAVRPVAPVPRLPGAGAQRTRASAAAAEDVTEVHVTIGRIELTAVQEAPRARPAPARTRKPQSLEEYLARRGTERR